MLAAGVVGVTIGAMNLTFYEALDRISLGVAVTLEFLGPLGLAVAGSRRPLDVLWVLLAMIGITVLTDPRGGLDLVGALLALVAGGFWALYIVLAQQTATRVSGSRGLALALCAAAAVALAPGIIDGGAGLVAPQMLALGTAVGLLSAASPWSLEAAALRRLPARVFGILGVPPLWWTSDDCAVWPVGEDVSQCRDLAVLAAVPV